MWKTYKFQDLISKTRKIRGIKTNEYKTIGKYPVIDQGNKYIAGFSDNEGALYKDTLPVVIFGDHTLAVKFVNFSFCIGADGTQILKPNEEIIIGKFLYYSIQKLNIQSLGYSRHFKVLKEATLQVPSLEDQDYIVKILDQADSLRQKRKQAIILLDEYLKSVFLEMFGDPVSNPKMWEKKTLNSFGEVITGNTPPRTDKNNYSSNYIEWIKTDNIVADNIYLILAKEYLSEAGLKRARSVKPGAVLMACIAGSADSIGRVAIANRKVSFNQQINAIQPNEKIDPFFLYWLFKISKLYIQNQATKGMKKILTKGEFEKIRMIIPPLNLQNKFAEAVQGTEALKQKMLLQSQELDTQFQALMQKSFLHN